MKKYYLVESSRRIITTNEYPTKEKAREAMLTRLVQESPDLKDESEEEIKKMNNPKFGLAEETAWAESKCPDNYWNWKILEIESGFIIPEFSSLGCYRGNTTDEDLALAEELISEEESITGHLLEEMMSDDADESGRLVWVYKNVNEDIRSILDYALVSLCGYTLGTLISQMADKK